MPYVCDTLWHVKLAGSTVLYDPILTKKRKKKLQPHTSLFGPSTNVYARVCLRVYIEKKDWKDTY